MKKPVVIIGAGLAGLSASYHLEKHGFTGYTLIEKEAKAGGICRSFTIKGFTYDYGPHVVFTDNSYVKNLIIQVLLKENLQLRARKAFVYYKGIYTEFPFQAHLYGHDSTVIKECILGLFKEKCGEKIIPNNFEEWIHATFGAGIARHFMFPYNRKLWATDLKTMDYMWINDRVPVPEIDDVLEGALQPPYKTYGSNADFWYPLRGGINSLAKSFLPMVRNLKLNSEVIKINFKQKEVYTRDGLIEYESLISTLPIPKLISLIDDVPPEVNKASDKLESNVVYTVNLGIDRPKISDYDWVYFPEEQYVFHRITFPMNFSPFMAPQDKSSITAEISVSTHKDLKMSEEQLKKAVIDGLLESAVIDKKDRVLFANTKRLDPAYIIYKHGRKENVQLIHEFCNQYNIFPCGRFGDWEYLNMDQAILSGQKAAEIIAGKF